METEIALRTQAGPPCAARAFHRCSAKPRGALRSRALAGRTTACAERRTQSWMELRETTWFKPQLPLENPTKNIPLHGEVRNLRKHALNTAGRPQFSIRPRPVCSLIQAGHVPTGALLPSLVGPLPQLQLTMTKQGR